MRESNGSYHYSLLQNIKVTLKRCPLTALDLRMSRHRFASIQIFKTFGSTIMFSAIQSCILLPRDVYLKSNKKRYILSWEKIIRSNWHLFNTIRRLGIGMMSSSTIGFPLIQMLRRGRPSGCTDSNIYCISSVDDIQQSDSLFDVGRTV